MKTTSDLRSWASLLSPSSLRGFADAVSDAADIEAQWALLVQDNELANPGEAAAAIYGGVARATSARLRRFAPGVSPAHELPPSENLRHLFESVCHVCTAAGLDSPTLRPPRKPTRWWEEAAGDGVGFKYLAEVAGRTDHTRYGGVDMRWATKWAIDLDAWKFEIAADGSLRTATRKR